MADFGFAKYVGDERTFTICGTPDYQVRGRLLLSDQIISHIPAAAASSTEDLLLAAATRVNGCGTC